MRKRMGESGGLNVLLVPLVAAVLFFFAAFGFGIWAFLERQDYKNNSDKKAEQAAAVAAKQTASSKDNEFIEREKEPYREYRGSADLGSIVFSYPKTWSGYIDSDESSESSFIFHPHVVVESDGQVYALRVTVESSAYEDALGEFDQQISQGLATATAYKLPKVPDVLGIRVDGEYERDKRGSIVILPLRDKTIKIATESQDYIDDFNKIILPNFSFSP